MAGPGDSLFLALANAKSQPSHALRAVQSAGEASQDILGGYLQGKNVQQQLEQYRLLATPLGQMYSDPSQIPFGLSPSHTVKDLLMLAPAMENYVPANVIRGAAGAYGANVSDGGNPPPPSIPGSGNPAPSSGQTSLAMAGGDGSGNVGNLAPGVSPTLPPQPSTPTINIPPGGMGMKGFQTILQPALKAGQEERQFRERQGAEESRFERQQTAEESRFGRGKMAGVAEEASKNLANTGTIQDDINTLRDLYRGYNPIPFVGGVGAALAGASGSSTFGTWTMQQGNKINQVAPALGAKINYELTHRFSPGESQLLMTRVVPTATDNEANATMKLNNLQRLVAVFQSGDQNAISMVATAIAGQPIRAQIPLSKTYTNINPQISLAQDWLRKNPNSPKAAAVRARLLAMQNGQ